MVRGAHVRIQKQTLYWLDLQIRFILLSVSKQRSIIPWGMGNNSGDSVILLRSERDALSGFVNAFLKKFYDDKEN